MAKKGSTAAAKKLRDTESLTEFRRQDAAALTKRLKRHGRPVTLTVNGEPAVVVQDAAAYRELVEKAARAAEAEEARENAILAESIQDMLTGRTVPALEFFDKLGQTKDRPRMLRGYTNTHSSDVLL